MAEGSVYAPILSSGAQGRKGGFATLCSQPPTTRPASHPIPVTIKPFSRGRGNAAWHQQRNLPELGAGANQADQAVLAGDSDAPGRCQMSGESPVYVVLQNLRLPLKPRKAHKSVGRGGAARCGIVHVA